MMQDISQLFIHLSFSSAGNRRPGGDTLLAARPYQWPKDY